MSIKLLALDLDGTLAQSNQAIADSTIQLLKQTAAQNVQIAILSGKPTAYLTGLARQLGISNIILSGENGAEVQFGLSYPPSASYSLSAQPANHSALFDYLRQHYPDDIWIQPNRVNFSVFAKPELLPELYSIVKTYSQDQQQVYLHSDCVELVDGSVSKGKALAFILQQLNLTADEVCAIGDGENDIPLLKSAKLRFAINSNLAVENLQVFDSIELALNAVQQKL